MKKTLFWLASACTLALLLSSCSEVKPKAQDKKTPDLKTSETTENPQASSSILLMSYNLYNFFDTQHDEGKNDYGFLSKEICKEKEEERFSRCTKSCERETEKRDMKLKGEFKTAEGKEKKNYDVELSLSDEKYKETDEKKCKKKCRDDKNKDIKRYCVDWNQEKYLGKLNQLKKVFDLRKSTSEESTYPDIVGFVEIENERVAKDIASLLGYKNQVTTNGPDNRGIDVALLYNTSDDLKYVSTTSYLIPRVQWEGTRGGQRSGRGYPTRPILEVEFLYKGHPLFVYVNHWSSLRNDTNNRVFAAEKLRKAIERKASLNKNASFIAMGDFNTEDMVEKQADWPHPFHNILKKGVQDLPPVLLDAKAEKMKLNLSTAPGTYYFSNAWQDLDRFFVSSNLANDSKGLKADFSSFKIFNHIELSERCDPQYCSTGALVPWRYDFKASPASSKNLGFSDHYPIYIRILAQ